MKFICFVIVLTASYARISLNFKDLCCTCSMFTGVQLTQVQHSQQLYDSVRFEKNAGGTKLEMDMAQYELLQHSTHPICTGPQLSCFMILSGLKKNAGGGSLTWTWSNLFFTFTVQQMTVDTRYGVSDIGESM